MTTKNTKLLFKMIHSIKYKVKVPGTLIIHKLNDNYSNNQITLL